MLPAALFAPPGLLVVGALLTWGLGCTGLPSRWLAVGAAWLALAALVVAWLAVGRQLYELTPPFPTGPIPLVLRLDPVSFAFGLAVTTPVSLLLTFQQRSWEEAGAAVLATGFALLAVEAGSLVLTALALGACASVVAMVLCHEHEGTPPAAWGSILLGAFVLLWAAAAIEVLSGGTSLYSAVPVDALKVQVFMLILAAAALFSGLLPWRTWVGDVWRRPRLEAAGLAVALLIPLGFLLLVRTYMLGGGSWPSPWLHWMLTTLGAAVALAAAFRAQSAPDRRTQFGESVSLVGGLALLALSLGTPLGLAAAVTGILAGALGAVLGLLLPAGGRVTLLGVPLVAGVPPSLSFGAWLLTVQAALESSPQMALWVLPVGAAWFLGYAAAARAVSLPAGNGRGSRAGSVATSALVLLGGAGLGAVEQIVALPAAGEVIKMQPIPITGGFAGVLAASGGFGALGLSLPLLVLLLLLAFLTRPLPEPPAPAVVVASRHSPPRPALPWIARLPDLPATLREALTVDRLEGAMGGNHPLLWAAVALVVVLAVTR